jgi:branched-subunit amino acid aminotransferase/4-amino-4-deoxychorismate lyase
MPAAEFPRIEIDGGSASPEQLAAAALDGYGHFTSMQVRNHRVRGLDLHLARLAAAQREMFGTELDDAKVREFIRHALGSETSDATVRVCLRQADDEPSIMVTVRPPGEMPVSPWRLRTVPYQRPVAHIKHLSDFGQDYFQRQARRNGYDEALLTGPDGLICEGSITNIGFLDRSGIVWPAAPVLAGITWQILQARMGDFGLASRSIPIRVADIPSFDAAFVTNARGLAPVAEIDDVTLPVNVGLMTQLTKAYTSVGWDRI